MKFFKDLQIKAVLIGLVADVGGTTVFFFVFSLLGMLLLASVGRVAEELEEYTRTMGFLVPASVGGSLFSIFGGFVSGRIAGKAELKNACATGILSTAAGALFLIVSPGPSPLWLNVAALVAVVPCSVLGGYLCLKSTQKKRTGRGSTAV
ncbi:MAG: hypothetical protein M1497_15700 [Nitrospirae bacterium]|nr:hypothetical protein [Nitrospirota bacterium]